MDGTLHGSLAPAGKRLPAGQQAVLRGGPPPPSQSQPQDHPAR